MLFGLVGYITYRLTRSKMVLVTCENCGRMRRCDMELCHRCASEWEAVQLVKPTWRVIDWPRDERAGERAIAAAPGGSEVPAS